MIVRRAALRLDDSSSVFVPVSVGRQGSYSAGSPNAFDNSAARFAASLCK